MLFVAARLLVLALALAYALGAAAAAAASADQTLQLEVILNGYPTGKIGELVSRDGALYIRPQELADLGFRVPPAAPLTPDGLLALSSLKGVTARLDQTTQTLYLQAGAEQLQTNVFQVRQVAASGAPLRSSLGATFDYDLVGSTAQGRSLGSGLFDLRVFSPWGVASTSLLGYAGAAPNGASNGTPLNSAIRLDSTYVYSAYSNQLSYRLGDVINGGLAWTRPVRLGGVQVARDFSMRPDLVTFPLPALAGAVAVPSSLDVLVNGGTSVSRQIPPGPFEVSQLPVVAGAGTLVMTLTDSLGRQVTTTLPFYASPRLLAPGLQTYSLETGFVRRGYGTISNDYGAFAASATFRRGLSSNFTLEAHAEGGAGQAMAGMGLSANVFNAAVVNLAAAGSAASGRTRWLLSIGAEHIGRVFNFGVSTNFADPEFRDLAAINGESFPARQISASVGLTLRRLGGLSLAYAGIDRTGPTRADAADTTRYAAGPTRLQAQHAHILSASYAVQAGRVSISATGFHDFAAGGQSGVSLGLTIPFGVHSSASANVNAQAKTEGQAQAQRTPVSVGDWGYLAYADVGGGPDHEFVEGLYKAPWALLSAGVDRLGGVTTFRAEAQGALTLADRGLFATNPIPDSFAIVDTAGVSGISVLNENRLVGRTDGGGRLLVPDLRAFEPNRLAIDPNDAPLDVAVPDPDREVRPPYRSGVVVRFPMRRLQAALLTLVDEGGKPLPPGCAATLKATGAKASVGFDGQTYVEGLGGHNRLAVELPAGKTCVAEFEFHPSPGQIPRIGPLTCKVAAP